MNLLTKAKRSLSGRKAQHVGQGFELLFGRMCLIQRVKCTRIPDGCKQLSQHKIVRVPTPWDWILSHQGKVALLDTKTCAENFPHSAIEAHQVDEMLGHCQNGTIAGYVIWLRKIDHVIYVPAPLLNSWRHVRGSITPESPGVLSLGSSLKIEIKKLFAP